MTQPVSQIEINIPASESLNTIGLAGSIQQILSENLGVYVVCDFLIGTQSIERRAGILYAVNVGYLVLYDDIQDNYVVCDMYSIKFVTFYDTGSRPTAPTAGNGGAAA